jgi:hypothetical protein
MQPVDDKLLRDWAHIKDEGKKEKLMLQHVRSEYPVNMEAITSDPTERRLHRLVATMGNLKLPNDFSEPSQAERASRTWRGVVF